MSIDQKLQQQLITFLDNFLKSYKSSLEYSIDKFLDIHPREFEEDCERIKHIIRTEYFRGKKLITVIELKNALYEQCQSFISDISWRRSLIIFGSQRLHFYEKTQNKLYIEIMDILSGKYGYFTEALEREAIRHIEAENIFLRKQKKDKQDEKSSKIISDTQISIENKKTQNAQIAKLQREITRLKQKIASLNKETLLINELEAKIKTLQKNIDESKTIPKNGRTNLQRSFTI